MSQSGQNVLVAFRAESAFNTAPGTGSGLRFRLNPSPGLQMNRSPIVPGEIRADQLTPTGRLGSRSVSGSYNGDLSVDAGFAEIFQAQMRSTWVAPVEIDETDVTSITITGNNTIVAASGSWITLGARVGDVVRLTNQAQAANNNLNLLVLSVTATDLVVFGNGSASPLTDDAVADTSFELTILRKIINGATPTKRTFYFEEFYQDIGESLLFGGCKVDSINLRGTPDGMAEIEVGIVGASQSRLESGPYYVAPALGTNRGLVFADATLLLGGAPILTATAFDLSMSLSSATLPVIGAVNTPGVFDNSLVVSGSFSALRDDLARVDAFNAETEFELHILLEEPLGTPRNCISLFLPQIKYSGAGAPLGEEGGMVEALPFTAGVRAAASGYDASMLTICTEV